MIDPSLWRKGSSSKFLPDLDIEKVFTVVASSGALLIPDKAGRDRSYIFHLGRMTGGGMLGGKWRDFYAVRLVNPNDPETIHIFPDDIRSIVDREVICTGCDKAYKVSDYPDQCDCGRRLRHTG